MIEITTDFETQTSATPTLTLTRSPTVLGHLLTHLYFIQPMFTFARQANKKIDYSYPKTKSSRVYILLFHIYKNIPYMCLELYCIPLYVYIYSDTQSCPTLRDPMD